MNDTCIREAGLPGIDPFGQPLPPKVHPPLNVAWVIDRSATMKGARIKNVKESLERVIDLMPRTDRIAVVTFAEHAQVILPCRQATDPVGMKATIERIDVCSEESGRGRRMSEGIRAGLSELKASKRPSTVSRLVLLTDGTGDDEDANQCRKLAQEAASAMITISLIGIGQEWDEALLDDIGELSCGMPADYLRRPEDAWELLPGLVGYGGWEKPENNQEEQTDRWKAGGDMADITCLKCGTTNREAARFCRVCGSGMVALLSSKPEEAKPLHACAQCGTPHREGAKFCTACGNRIVGEQETASTSPAPNGAKPLHAEQVAPMLQQEPPSILDQIRREFNISKPYQPKKKKKVRK